MKNEPSPALHALLGPTNTGKTHRAIERMLDFESGMMGLPLRLLAREVYERVSARVGEQAVALVTGEEKRVPARPRYWICTVEAMPPGLPVEFLAVDEIQLVGHPERGHVFTDRLLSWRGSMETWFLGSDTAEPLLREQLRGLRVDRLPRLSRLRYVGQASVRTLPRRSAVVAFGMQQVYQLADIFRVRRGGAAVVLGALSPRVRNAQVAMYQAGEVDFLVATDAIGMGLNLDIEHVALAADVKFDGRETRQLEVTELAQIVGRAGRYLRDGTFGTLSPLPELAQRVVQRLESHHFPAQRSAYYRNAQLDFSSLATLWHALEARPPHPALRPAPEADDQRILRALRARPEIVQRCSEPAQVAALWDLCRIPNYEKQIPEHQAERLVPLFLQLTASGWLQPAYLDTQLRRLERYDGDIDVLLARLAAVRTWLYVCHQRGWVQSAGAWQERTRALEDRLGDLLHQRLLARFVNARAGRRPSNATLTVRERSLRQRDSHHPFAKLAAWASVSGEPERDPETQFVESLVAAPYAELVLRENGELWHADTCVARLLPGKTILTPVLQLRLPSWVEPGAHSRIERRLAAHLKDVMAHLLEPLYPRDRSAPQVSAPLRGLLYQLEQQLGNVERRAVEEQVRALAADERTTLQRWNITLGRASVYAREMLSSDRLQIRATLCGVWQVNTGTPATVGHVDDSVWTLPHGSDRTLCQQRGFVPLQRWAVRCDLLELLLQRLPGGQAGDAARIAQVRLLLGCSEADAASLLRVLPRGRRGRRRRKRTPPTAKTDLPI